MTGTIRAAGADDIPAIQAVGAASGRRFAEIDDPRIAACADDDPIDASDLQGWVDAGRAWVALDADEAVVGFVVVDLVDGHVHVEEIAVHPDHERRGHATSLLDAVSTWARAGGRSQVTLTTFADVPWNRPYYERRGFRVLTDAEVGPELHGRVAEEDVHGLPAKLRVCMGRVL